MIGQCVYIIKFSNGAWKVGYTGSINTRLRLLKTAHRDLSPKLEYLFKVDDARSLESKLLYETRNFDRFMGDEYFYASDEDVRAVVVKNNLISYDTQKELKKNKQSGFIISDTAWQIIRDYQEENKIKTRDEALDTLLLHFYHHEFAKSHKPIRNV